MSRKILFLIAAFLFSSTVNSQVTRKTEGTPVIGDKYELSIQFTSNRKIILPQGVWEVNNVFDDKEASWHAPYKVITFINTNKESPFKILVTRLFLQTTSKWGEEPCEKKSNPSTFGYLKNNNIAGKTVCAQYAVLPNPQIILKNILPSKYKFHWEKALSKLTDEHIKNISENSLLLETYANKSGDLYIKQEMFIDPTGLGITGDQFKYKFNDNTSDPVVRMANWRERYIAKMVDAFFNGKDPTIDDVTLVPVQDKNMTTANSGPVNVSSDKNITSSANESIKQDSDLKKLEDERRKLDEERRLLNEQKALAEERRILEEEKRQFEISKQNIADEKIKADLATAKKLEQEEKQRIADEKIKADLAISKKMEQDEKQRIADEKKNAELALAKKMEQEEKQRIADEKKKTELALAKKLEQEEKQRIADEKKKAELALAKKLEQEEKQRIADEKIKAEADKQRLADDIKKAGEEKQRLEREMKKAEAEIQRLADEKKKSDLSQAKKSDKVEKQRPSDLKNNTENNTKTTPALSQEIKNDLQRIIDLGNNGDLQQACSIGKATLRKKIEGPSDDIKKITEGINELCQAAEEQAKAKNAPSPLPDDAMIDYLKESCKKYYAAKERCATAGDYDKCMRVLVPSNTCMF